MSESSDSVVEIITPSPHEARDNFDFSSVASDDAGQASEGSNSQEGFVAAASPLDSAESGSYKSLSLDPVRPETGLFDYGKDLFGDDGTGITDTDDTNEIEMNMMYTGKYEFGSTEATSAINSDSVVPVARSTAYEQTVSENQVASMHSAWFVQQLTQNNKKLVNIID